MPYKTLFWKVSSCAHGPTKNFFERFLAVRMALQNTFLMVFGVLSGIFSPERYTKKSYLTPALDNNKTAVGQEISSRKFFCQQNFDRKISVRPWEKFEQPSIKAAKYWDAIT